MEPEAHGNRAGGQSLAELQSGIRKSPRRHQNHATLTDLLAFCRVLDWPHQAAAVYGEPRARIGRQGQVIGGNDLLIAAHALHLGATLVTHNTQEFSRVPRLKL